LVNGVDVSIEKFASFTAARDLADKLVAAFMRKLRLDRLVWLRRL
jgi:hypothetical protein